MIKTSRQLKDLIHNLSKEKFILKGGMLVAAMAGIVLLPTQITTF